MSPKKKDVLLPEHLPSTTRAVAWGALFFAVLAFIVSVVTFGLCYKDGAMAERATNLMREVRSSVKTAADTGDKESSEPLIDWSRVDSRLQRIQGMIAAGDVQARYHLEALMDDLEGLRNYTTEKGSAALGGVIDSLERARDYTGENAPEALTEIDSVLSSIHEKTGEKIDEIGKAIEDAKSSGSGQ